MSQTKPSKKKSRWIRFFSSKSKERNTIIILGAAVVLLMISISAYFIVNHAREAKAIAAQSAAEEARRNQQTLALSEYQQFLSSDLFYHGISIEGIDVGGKTIAEARTLLTPLLSSHTLAGDLKLMYGGTEYLLDRSSISASVNLEETLSAAFQLARNGSYDENKAIIDELEANGRDFKLIVSYDFNAVSMRVQEIAAAIDVAPQDASVQAGTEGEQKIAFTAEVEGVCVLQDELTQAITDAILNESGAPITIPVQLVAPACTKEHLESVYKLRSSATTSFKGSSTERKYNIRKGAGLINGTVLKPGEVFSANDTLGVRTSSNGWKIAGAYESGATVQQAGGGVCQLSSTLYNAAVKADLEIVYRRNHSMPVSYISQGLDATINSVGNLIDFKFKNNAVSDIIIFAFTEGNSLTFEIYGPPFDTDEYDEIKLSSKKLETLPPSTEIIYVLDETLAPGTEVVNVNRQNGSRWQSYKHYYKNGEEVRKEKLDVSTYKSFAGEILKGPDPTPTPLPTHTPVPTPTPPTATAVVPTAPPAATHTPPASTQTPASPTPASESPAAPTSTPSPTPGSTTDAPVAPAE